MMTKKGSTLLLAIVLSLSLLLSGCTQTQTHIVSFDVNGGVELSSGNGSKKVTEGEAYGALPTPTRTGYSFEGWYTKKTGGTEVTSSSTVRNVSRETLYAHWTKNTTTAPRVETPPKIVPPPAASTHGDIKGNVSYNTGERIYHMPGCPHYNDTVINAKYGERWFFTESEAQEAGWRHCRGY
jgi:uncharacterized repeat protein (TIGR02543 family)